MFTIDSGRKLLGNIFKNNPQLGSFISSNALFSSDQAFYHNEAFYHLAKYNNGHEILNYLLDSVFKYSNWELAQALCKPLSNTNFDKYRHTTSPLYWLTCSETGLEVLLKMLKNNDELATMIAKDDALTLKRLGAGKSVGQNPLLLINKSPKTGQEIIVILKQANPELVNFLSTSIPENDSYTVSHNHSASRNNSANTFAFFPRQNTTQQINYEEKSPGLGN